MRKALLAAAVFALLVVLYAAAGQWLAPRLLRDALAERAQRLGLALHIGEVRTDPFDLEVTLQNVVVRSGERELGRVRELSADLAWASLWRDAWVVEQVTLLDPAVELTNAPAPPAAAPRHEDLPAIAIQELRVESGVLTVAGRLKARLEGIGLRATGLSTIPGNTGQYELAARLASGGQLASQGSLTLQPLSAEGSVRIEALALGAFVEAAQGRLHGTAQYAYESGTLLMREVSVEGARLSYAGVALAHASVRVPRVALPAQQPFEVRASAALAPQGKVSASGRVGLQPLSADLELEAAGVPLAQAGRFLPDDLQVAIASGSASASGRLRIEPQQSSFEGAVAVSDARFEERPSGELLLAWEEVETQQAVLSFAPFRAQLAEVRARAPSGRLVIEEDGRPNFARVMPDGEDQGGGKPEVTLRGLRIERGTLDFTDRSLDNDFSITVRELEGSITGFSTTPGDPARVQLSGRVARYGSARIRGSVDLQAPKSLTNISATLRNVPLAELTPYVVKFAGYRVQSGRLSAVLRYRVREGRLVGQNQLTFEELQLGEKVERAGVTDLPLELAVALLADARGRIRLDIPVSGNLNDPQFDFGGLVARALGNVVGKIVSAPFRALAAVLGKGGEALDQVRFAPGSAEISPPAEETLAEVAKALAARPALAVTVQGGYDPQRDLEALRRAHVRREIARRADVDPRAPLDFGDPRVLQAAERLYLERAGNRLQMLDLRESEPRYARALVEALVAATPADVEAAQILARARAHMVRAALLAHGLDPSRVAVQAPASRQAGNEGVPTELALDTADAAAAGATVP